MGPSRRVTYTKYITNCKCVAECVDILNRHRRDGCDSNQKLTARSSNFCPSLAHNNSTEVALVLQPREQTYLRRHRWPILRDEQNLILLPRDWISYKRQDGDSVALRAPRGAEGALPLPDVTIRILPCDILEADPPKTGRVERLRGENRRSALWGRSSSPHDHARQ